MNYILVPDGDGSEREILINIDHIMYVKECISKEHGKYIGICFNNSIIQNNRHVLTYVTISLADFVSILNSEQLEKIILKGDSV